MMQIRPRGHHKIPRRIALLPIAALLIVNLIFIIPYIPSAGAAQSLSLDNAAGNSNRCSAASSCSTNSKTFLTNDVLAVCVTIQSSGAIGISSSPILTWTQIGSTESVSSTVQVECWWATTPVTQSILATATSSVTSNMVILVQGFQGVNVTSPIDGTGCGSTGPATPSSCGITTYSDNDIIISLTAVSGSSSLTPAPSFTEIFSDSGSPATNMEYENVSSSQNAIPLSFGYTNSRSYAQIGWAFTAAFPISGKTINLSNDSFNASLDEQHTIAASGSNVYATWVESVGVGGAQQVLFRASQNNGSTFGPVINMSSDNGPATLPKVAADGNNVYVVWRDQSSGNPLVYLRASSDRGTSFGPTVHVSDLPSIEPKIAACSGAVFVSWVNSTARAQNQHTPAKYTMFFRASQDGGKTWLGTFNLQNDDKVVANGNEEEVECSGHSVYVAYSDWSPGIRSVFLRASHDLGKTFVPHVEVFVPSKGNIREPVVSVGKNYVYVYWIYRSASSTNYQTYLRPSPDNGTTWGMTVNLCSDSNDCHEPFLVATGADVYVVLHEFVSTANTKLYFRASHDGGVTWGTKIDMIPGETGKSSFGSISASGNWVFVGYSNKTKGGSWEMFLTMSKDKGVTFGPTYNLSSNPGASGVFIFGHQERALATANKHIYAIWEDNDTPTSSIDLFFKSVQFA